MIMKNALVLCCALLIATGCASGVQKRFSITTEPPDAEILLFSGEGDSGRTYRSPADIRVSMPSKARQAAQARIEVTREAYKPRTIRLGSINDGDRLSIKLEKITHYLLKYRMLSPARSENMQYRDRTASITLVPREHHIDMTFTNLSPKPIKILWDRAEYTDYVNRKHRLMHAGVRPQDRNNIIPPQEVAPGETLQQTIMPVDSLVYSREQKEYVPKPLFPVDSEAALALKGRKIYLFLPLEYDRTIIPDYNFRIEIEDVIKDK